MAIATGGMQRCVAILALMSAMEMITIYLIVFGIQIDRFKCLHYFSHPDWHRPIKSRDSFDCAHFVRRGVAAKSLPHWPYSNSSDFSIHLQRALHFSPFYQIFCQPSVVFVAVYTTILHTDYIHAMQPHVAVYYHAENSIERFQR